MNMATALITFRRASTIPFAFLTMLSVAGPASAQTTADIAVLGATDRLANVMGGVSGARMTSFFDVAADPFGGEFCFTGQVAGIGATSELAWVMRPTFTDTGSAQPIAQLCNNVPNAPSPARFGFFDGPIVFRNSNPMCLNTMWTCGQGALSNPSILAAGRSMTVNARQGATFPNPSLPDAVLLGPIGAFAMRFSNSATFFSDYGTLAAGVLGRGLFFSSGSPQAVQRSALLGEAVVGGEPGLAIDGFEESDLLADGDAFVRVRLRGGATTASSDTAVIRATTGSAFLMSREGQQAFLSGTGGLTLGNILSLQTLSNFGTPIILAELRGTGVTQANDTALCLARPGTAEVVVREGAQVPDLAQGVIYSELGSAVGSQDFLMFTARLAGAGVTPSNDEAIFLVSPIRSTSVPVLIAREGNAVPGQNANFGALFVDAGRSLAFPPNGFGLTPIVAFASPLTGNGVTPANNFAVFLAVVSPSAPFVSVTKALRTGDLVPTSPGINRIISNINFSTRSGGGDGRQSSLTREGTVAARVTFADGAEGVLAARLANLCPIIARQPNPEQTARPGRAVSLDVAVVGSNPLTFQWFRGVTPLVDGTGGIHGSTTSVLTIDPAREDAEGDYSVVISNSCGTITSAVARVTVLCGADFDDGSGFGIPDGGVTIDDLLYYLQQFERGVDEADVDDGSGTNTLDGGVTIDDLLYFLARFEAGC